LRGSTGKLFKNEVVVNAANGDGFSHNPSGFMYKVYNDAFTKTLSSNVDRGRGNRSDCVVFDECGFLDGNLIEVYKAFCAVDNSFATGFDENGNSIDIVRLMAMPQAPPKQLIYISSASSVDTEYYKIYRDYSKQMIAGDPDYFVANIDCELAMRPTIHNVPTVSLLTRDMIEATMRTNPIKGRREYYCEFSEDAGADAIIKRGVITRNEETRVPLLFNDTGTKRFILAYDPARSMDNSVIGVMELYEQKLVDGSMDLRGRIVNCANLMDVGKKLKTPMQTPDQVRYLKQMILDYNAGIDAYGNIIGVYIDAGSGGGGVNIADYLMSDWETADGIVHRGLIDREYSSEYVPRFPNAVDKVKLLSPSTYKSIIYEALIEMMNQNKISFTASYDNKGYLTLFDIDEKKLAEEREKITEKLKKKKLNQIQYEEQFNEELEKVQAVNTRIQKLTWQEELALANVDAMKEEVVNIVRKKRDSGRDSFDLTPEKARILHKHHCAYAA
jgi:CRISPR/Cas system-associated endoribonuclease Cas2